MIPVAFIGSFPAADFRLAPGRPEIAFLGRSNVGKSSLLNALAGRRALARTSHTPGRTRACNVFNAGDRCYYVDLPGYGYAQLSQAQRRSLARLVRDYVATRGAAGVVWLLDLRRDPSADDLAIAKLLAEHSMPVLAALTKADRVPRGRRRERMHTILHGLGANLTPEHCVFTSARTKEGIVALRKAIERLVERR
ncbi:MAG: ribosome biogenesis GTP-binding protein YsxC [Gemmatimonadetes bacterium]|nr:ribosome biogenesis GTP-binding protein YsxC [Gemmatimonadota bacterium]MBI2401444.1 ribosome biogenesis GTP-binding protein YsxC [Gemmatimonadota bacterium]MBI2536865.1 ribosome biogenesis GTP-binding protein YsxC [Gemmatimonadota bacterium]